MIKKLKETDFRGKGQSKRLGKQHELAGGPKGIFGKNAQIHDASAYEVSKKIYDFLKKKYSNLNFRHRTNIPKKEINFKLKSIDNKLGEVLFVKDASIKPDGGIIEVKDSSDNWRIILIGESKHQGNDIEKIVAGVKQGKNKDQDLMTAGNAIERVHKNILEFRNLMLDEIHFPYVVFFQGSNFATETFFIKDIKIAHDSGGLNRIDRTTSSSYSMKINKNYCKNIFIKLKNNSQMLQVPSMYYQCESWTEEKMCKIMLKTVVTSIKILTGSLPKLK